MVMVSTFQGVVWAITLSQGGCEDRVVCWCQLLARLAARPWYVGAVAATLFVKSVTVGEGTWSVAYRSASPILPCTQPSRSLANVCILTQQVWVGLGFISEQLLSEASATGLGPQ